MEIQFISPSAEDVKSVYETYRLAGEPDSPIVPFENLSEAEKTGIVNGYQRVIQIAICAEQKVGWITVINRNNEPEINLGFGLFTEFRGKSLMTKIIRRAAKDTSQKHTRKISAEARVDNIAAIKTLENADFIQMGVTEQSPSGKWKEPVKYMRFVFGD